VAGSTIASMLTHPLDLIKTRLQVQSNTRQQYTGFIDAFKTIIRTEGPAGLYGGLTPSVVGNGVAWGAYFGMYRLFQTKDEFSSLDQTRAATIAGFITSVLTNPIWVVKSRMQLQRRNANAANYKSTLDAMKVIYVEEGIRGFYAGMALTLLNNTHGVVQMVVYERLRKYLMDMQNTPHLDFFPALSVAAASKIVSGLVCYPITTVRTRLQERPGHGLRYKNSWDAITTMLRTEGLRTFYRGAMVGTLRVLPHSAVTFALIEQFNYKLFK
jgi:solute carrier family 25 folate transporter 32